MSEIPPKVGRELVTSGVAGECVSHLATVNRRINAFEVYGLPLLEYNSSVWPSSLKYLIELLIIIIIIIIS